MDSGSEYLLKDERLKKPSRQCDECAKDLQIEIDDILYFHKSSQKWLCHDCYKDIVIDEDIIYFRYRLDGQAEMIRTRTLGAGGERLNSKQKSAPLEISLLLDSNKKCQHSIEYFNEFNLIFYCVVCGEWICPKCLKKHKGHSIMSNPRIGLTDEFVQLIPYYYDTIIKPENIDVIISTIKRIQSDNKIQIKLKIQNMGNEPINNITIYAKLNFTLLNQASEFNIYEIKESSHMDLIEPGTNKKKNLEIETKNLQFDLLAEIPILITLIYKDFYDSSSYQEFKFKSYID